MSQDPESPTPFLELAAQTEHLQAVLNTGLRCLSVPAAALGRVKAALAACQLAAD